MKHVHKYRKVQTTKGKTIWRCVIPRCSHVIYQEELMEGREHMCWSCNEPFTLSREDLDRTRPTCRNCKDRRKLMIEKMGEARRLG